MGTAPSEQQRPAMPDPARLVTRSIVLLRRLGMGREQALVTVVAVARTVRTLLQDDQRGDYRWIEQVIERAEYERAVAYPSNSEHDRSDYGDGSSSSPGRQASGPQTGPGR